ncbi:hypothetical protein Pan241w_11610 [Gimesia alba]|uniref:Uncharacterized protein n=1 Tax=Gimesia alba TaxID=2527973 RepID=A0A517RB41_9PLAN|nr:hypothetical protein [Gimesia alba]QDT41102.1 hypothetical protein Pan241w_11610 [Gimesia alba]
MEFYRDVAVITAAGLLIARLAWLTVIEARTLKRNSVSENTFETAKVEPIMCEGCGNLFFVQYGSDEFLPKCCCYCKSNLFFDENSDCEFSNN